VRTKAGDPNGQYGRVLPVDRVIVPGEEPFTPDGRTPIDHDLIDNKDYGHYDDGHEDNTAIECTFTEHSWKAGGASDAFRDYVSWTLGAKVILYSDWMTDGGEAVAKWILDDRSTTDCWAYWGAAVPPTGSTGNLLQTIKLDRQPDGDFYYAIHADMQAVDYTGLDSWADDNTDIVAALKSAAAGEGEEGDLLLLMSSYTPATANDRIFFYVQTEDPVTHAPWTQGEWEMYLDDEAASIVGAAGFIEIPLFSVVAPGQGVNLTDIEITDIQCPAGYSYTSAEIYIAGGKIVSKGLMSWDDYFNDSVNNPTGTNWLLQVPVVITLTDSVSGMSAAFTVNNMYMG